MERVKELFFLFNENSTMFVVFLVALTIIMVFFEDRHVKELLVFPSLIILLIVLNPMVLTIGTRLFAITRVVRLYWLFPIVVVLAYLCAKLLECFAKKRISSIAMTVLLVGLIIGQGKYMFSDENFATAENMYKLPDETVIICEAIKEDGYEGILVPSVELVDTIRQYDANIKLAYGRNPNGNYVGIGEVLNQSTIEVELLEKYFGTEDYTYLLINKVRQPDVEMLDKDFSLICETNNHWLYKYKY